MTVLQSFAATKTLKLSPRTRKALIGSLLPLAVCVLFYRLWDGVCPVRRMLGIPCPGCGMTRAVRALFCGDLAGAFAWHPLVWTLPLIALLLLRAVAPRPFGRLLDRIGIREDAYVRVERVLTVALLILFFAVYLFRLLSGWKG